MMRRAIVSTIGTLTIAVFAFAQTPPTPTPPTPSTPHTSAVPKAPKPPRPPRASRTSYLGVDSRDVTPERMGTLKLKSDKGVEILMVDQDSPAGKAGLREHDVIVSFNGTPVQDVNQLRRMIRSTKPGTKVTLGISRDGQLQNQVVELGDRSSLYASDHVIHIPRIEIPPMPEINVPSFAMLQYSRSNGLMVENLSRQLGEYFGAKDGRGVLVRSVEKNSPAEMAGFKAGDVIIRIGNEPVENMSDWNQILRQQQPGKVPVTVIREKREQTFTLSIPERRGDRSSGDSSVFDGGDVTIDLGDLGPEIQKELEIARLEMQKAFNDKEFQQAMRELQKDLAKNQKELQKQLGKAHKQVDKALKDIEKQKIRIEVEDENDFK